MTTGEKHDEPPLEYAARPRTKWSAKQWVSGLAIFFAGIVMIVVLLYFVLTRLIFSIIRC